MVANPPKGLPSGFVLWAGIARNETILVARGEDSCDGSVLITADELLKRDHTPGWEFHTQSLGSQLGLTKGAKGKLKSLSKTKSHYKPSRPLKGVKFHVYERGCDGEYIVWVFACVYNKDNISKEGVQTFLTKLVTDTELHREKDFEWLYGPELACQESFGPMLHHYMMEVSHLLKYSAIEKYIETGKERMGRNIDLLLEREPKLEDLHTEATALQEMTLVFKKKAREVKRMSMWQNAKHGVVMGTAIAAGVAIVVTPPLIVLL